MYTPPSDVAANFGWIPLPISWGEETSFDHWAASDVNKIYNKDLCYFKNLKFFIVDCLRFSKHSSHFNLDEVINLLEIIKPKKTILTNLHSDLDYNYLLKILPKNVIPAHDGLSLNL